MKNLAKFLLPITLLFLVNGVANAANHSGQITYYHLNSTVAGRDACIRMVPTIPAGNGWACVFNNNPLRTQITTLAREGFFQGSKCAVNWTNIVGGVAAIDMLDCGNTQ